MLSQSSWLCVVLSDSVSSYFGEMLWKKAVITPITVFPEWPSRRKKHSRPVGGSMHIVIAIM